MISLSISLKCSANLWVLAHLLCLFTGLGGAKLRKTLQEFLHTHLLPRRAPENVMEL